MKGTKKMGMLVLLAVVFAISSMTVFAADPLGAENITVESSSTRDGASGFNVSAIAGNVTELTIEAISVTQFWQGYYGNVTGTIVLANSNNDTLYDWSVSTATGEIYASTATSVTWASLVCADDTSMNAAEAAFGMDGSEVDGINETFATEPGNEAFYAGSTSVSNCPEVNLHDENGAATDGVFDNVLLSDGASLVFVSILHDDTTGFDNRSHDFQLIVPENGTNGNTDTTPYYFWVELA